MNEALDTTDAKQNVTKWATKVFQGFVSQTFMNNISDQCKQEEKMCATKLWQVKGADSAVFVVSVARAVRALALFYCIIEKRRGKLSHKKYSSEISEILVVCTDI